MAMTNLSLGALGRAVGVNGDSTSETKLAEDGRWSTGTSTAMSALGRRSFKLNLEWIPVKFSINGE